MAKNNARKGFAYERSLCVRLSLWWSKGEHSDLFWRTSGSGGRATRRKGKRTSGQHDDITSTHPSSAPFSDLIFVEAKKGYPEETIGEIIDKTCKGLREMEEWFIKAQRQSEEAGKAGWMVIHRRDRKKEMCYVDRGLWTELNGGNADNPGVRPYLQVCLDYGDVYDGMIQVVVMRLKDFLGVITPETIRDCARRI
jgi:hypothetical protein